MATLDDLCESLEAYHNRVDDLDRLVDKLKKKVSLYENALKEIECCAEQRGTEWCKEAAAKCRR